MMEKKKKDKPESAAKNEAPPFLHRLVYSLTHPDFHGLKKRATINKQCGHDPTCVIHNRAHQFKLWKKKEDKMILRKRSSKPIQKKKSTQN